MKNFDYCVRCGAEHGYMCGPCERCGGKVFSAKPQKPYYTWRIKLDKNGYDEHGGYFGVGEKLWGYTLDGGNTLLTLRAPTKKEANRQAKALFLASSPYAPICEVHFNQQ